MKKYLTNENPKIRRRPSCGSDFHIMKNIDLHFQGNDISRITKEIPSKININPDKLFEQTPIKELDLNPDDIKHAQDLISDSKAMPAVKNFGRKKRKRFDPDLKSNSGQGNTFPIDLEHIRSPVLPQNQKIGNKILHLLESENQQMRDLETEREKDIAHATDFHKRKSKDEDYDISKKRFKKNAEKLRKLGKNRERKDNAKSQDKTEDLKKSKSQRTRVRGSQPKIKESAFYEMLDQMQDSEKEKELECKNTLLSQETENNWLESIYKKD